MKKIILLLVPLIFSSETMSVSTSKDPFLQEAQDIARDLKSSLMSELTKKIAEKGAAQALPFCHENVKLIAKKTMKTRVAQYEFGRTSHKLRNTSNAPKDWMLPYLEKLKNKKKNEVSKSFFIHEFKDSKKAYLEPLFVGAQCLLCHGENVSSTIREQINIYYPQDKATGFKLGEFRGLIWVKQK